MTPLRGGNAPDVSTLDQIWMAAFAEAGAIVPLGDMAAEAGVTADTFFPGAWASANYDDELWGIRSEENTSELQSLMRISYAVCCLKQKNEHSRYRSKPTQEKTKRGH